MAAPSSTMKYLDYPQLSQLSSSLSNNPAPDVKLKVRIEAYSVKPIGKERKMFKEMEEAYVSEQEEMAESVSPNRTTDEDLRLTRIKDELLAGDESCRTELLLRPARREGIEVCQHAPLTPQR